MAMMGRLTTMKADKLFIVFGRKREIRLRSAKRLCKRMTKRRMKSRQNMKQALSTTLGRCAAAVFLLALLQSTFDTSTFAHAFCLRQRTACQHQLAKFCNPSDTLVRSRLLPDHHRQQRKPLFTYQKVLLEKQDFQQGLYATTVVSNDSKPCGCSVEASHHAHHHGSHGARQTTITSLSIVLWVLSMLSHGAPLLGHHGQHVLSKLRFAALPSVALAMPTVVAKAKHALFERRKIDASCMMLAASIGALALGEYTESAAVTSLFAVSEVLEDRAANHSASALSQVAQDIGPGRARLLVVSDDQIVAGDAGAFHNNTLKHDQEVAATSEQTIDVSADQVNVGALVSVPVGDKIPCDGVVLSGNTFLDESSVSGESRPLRRSTDNTVSAGSVNVGPERIVVRTTAMASESAVARLAKLVEDSLSQKSPTEVMIDKFAGRYAPFVFSMALFMAILPWAFSSRETGLVWTRRGLVTMVAACPCPLVISTPVSYIAALAVMAREGVIVKGGAVLEALGRVDKIAFDKTGTLTEGRFSLRNLTVTASDFGNKEVMEYLILMEAPSSHPLASALVDAARKEGVVAPKNVAVRNHTVLKGEGLVADIEGKIVHVGNRRLFERLGLYGQLSETERDLATNMESAGETVGFLSVEGSGIVCIYSVADAIRDEAQTVINKLEESGVEVCMLTGDGKGSAMAVANRISIAPARVHSELLPEDKLRIITSMKDNSADECRSRLWPRRRRTTRRGNTLMCGDGVNDGPALALADVSIAMGTGASLATKTSDVILTDSNLNKILDSIMIGRRVTRTILQNIIFSLVTKGAVVGLAAFGVTALWAAIASDVGTMLIVTTNGLRILSSRKGSNKAI